MSHFKSPPPGCRGFRGALRTINRRGVLQAGVASTVGLSLCDVLRANAGAAVSTNTSSVIIL
ncbi:MAG: hypothetical protein VB853_14745, partial [Pirellulales bacterium]